jgi:molybdate transport system substrate-binding protein
MAFTRRLAVIALLLLPLQLAAEPARVAVASNFTHAMQDIKKQFEQQSEHEVELIFGSTGKIYAQIINGAPFDAFFAADAIRPQRLEQEGRIKPGSRFSYAFGHIVLWSPDSTLRLDKGKVLENGQFRHLAIANPRLAPYGTAAKQVLQGKGVWQKLQSRIVRGENIGQTFQFVISGNAELGFIALSQLKSQANPNRGSHWLVPADLYAPIEQQAVQLTDKTAVSAFMDFVKSDAAKKIIHGYGYSTP